MLEAFFVADVPNKAVARSNKRAAARYAIAVSDFFRVVVDMVVLLVDIV
jgi:hypothetical protein